LKKRLLLEITFNYWGKNMSKRNNKRRAGYFTGVRTGINQKPLVGARADRKPPIDSRVEWNDAALLDGDIAAANEKMEELKNQFAELSTQAKKELRGTTLDQQLNTLRDRATEFESESKSWILREGEETLAEFFEASSDGDDNQKRLATLYSGLIDFYGREEAATLMEQWVSEHRNYFDFQIHRPKEQPGTDNDNLAPSMQSIDNVALAIKAFILSRIAYRMKSGGDHQTINIRVTMDDGIERKNRTSYE